MSFKPKGRAKRIAIGLALVSALVGPVMPVHASPPSVPGINTGVPACDNECVQDKVDHATVVVQNAADLVGRLATEMANGVKCAQTVPHRQTSYAADAIGPIDGFAAFQVYVKYCWYRYEGDNHLYSADLVVQGNAYPGLTGDPWDYNGYTGGFLPFDWWMDTVHCKYWDVTGHFAYRGVDDAWTPNSSDQVCV